MNAEIFRELAPVFATEQGQEHYEQFNSQTKQLYEETLKLFESGELNFQQCRKWFSERMNNLKQQLQPDQESEHPVTQCTATLSQQQQTPNAASVSAPATGSEQSPR